MKKDKKMIVCFITPAILTFLLMYVYPVVRTVIMSFFKMESVTGSMDTWKFAGLSNYTQLFKTEIFIVSLTNILKIWLVGGVGVLLISLFLAVILTSGVRGKNFFRAVIYLPNVISAVALATMWIQYIYSKRFGLLKFTGIDWLSSDMKFWAMLIAFMFGAIGYYMLIFLSGIERIPADYYEAATIDGANKFVQFFKITLPLLRGVFKTNITFWSINTISFFVWSQMFSPVEVQASTIVPVQYMFNIVFGAKGVVTRDPGRGAAIGVILAAFVIGVFMIMNLLVKDDDVEY